MMALTRWKAPITYSFKYHYMRNIQCYTQKGKNSWSKFQPFALFHRIEKYKGNFAFFWIPNISSIFVIHSLITYDNSMKMYGIFYSVKESISCTTCTYIYIYPIQFMWADLCYISIHKFLTLCNSFSPTIVTIYEVYIDKLKFLASLVREPFPCCGRKKYAKAIILYLITAGKSMIFCYDKQQLNYLHV